MPVSPCLGLAEQLRAKGHSVSGRTTNHLVRELGYPEFRKAIPYGIYDPRPNAAYSDPQSEHFYSGECT